jgi:hypothetical protein
LKQMKAKFSRFNGFERRWLKAVKND